MRQNYADSAKSKKLSSQLFLFAIFLPVPYTLVSQNLPASQSAKPSRSGGVPGEMSAEEIFKRFAGSVLFLTCDESADASSLASGVVVSADGFIVTNAHVVEQCRSMTATHIVGASRRSYDPVLKYLDEKSDTAILKIAGQNLDFLNVVARPVRIGERVYAIGNPRGLEQSISEGIVSGDRMEDGTSWIQHSAPISPGSSGGALISARGELLGINSRFRRESQNLNFAVPATSLAMALSDARTQSGILVFPPNAEAQLRLGLAYRQGHGVPKDEVQAAAWIRKAAEHLAAQTQLGEAYYFGLGVPQDYIQAVAWYRKAAERGHPAAQNYLGFLYGEGQGVPQDYVQAASWYRKAAEQGEALAQDTLGSAYANGQGVPKDYVQAAAWYRKAAEQGEIAAQIHLGFAYSNGQGLPKDYAESYFWIALAAEPVGQLLPAERLDVAKRLDTLATYLTAAELSRVQERAREWRATHATKAP